MELDRCKAINMLLRSIALEEMALAELVRSAARMDGTQASSVMKLVIKKELVLLMKLEEVLESTIIDGYDDCDK